MTQVAQDAHVKEVTSLGVALAAHLLSLLFCLRNIRTLRFEILSLLAVERVFSLISDLDSESYTHIYYQQLVDTMPSLGFFCLC